MAQGGSTMRISTTATLTALATALALLGTSPADAGCGCDKPPPPAAPVRPAFASPGDAVTLFAPGLEPGKSYEVRFNVGMKGSTVSVTATAVRRRDLADGVVKPQLVVALPAMPPGPTNIEVKSKGDRLLNLPPSAFTVLQAPLALEEADGETVAACYRAAVGADGTVYIPLDISRIAQHMIFQGLGESYPLLFGAEDIAIYNTQGFLMQLLGPDQAGIYAIDDPGQPSSFALTYDRHEFLTYREQHAHEGGYGLDPSDPAWHADGTRHIDHDRLVVAIHGVVENQGPPRPGVTPAFDLRITTALADAEGGGVSVRRIVWSPECGTN
jgi:hypothetical protein